METLSYTTSIISWQLIRSAIEMLSNSQSEINPIDFNTETIPCVVLSCIALEAFSNEISSLTNAFMYDVESDFDIKNLSANQKSIIGIDLNLCKNIAQIRNSKEESFYERYKKLLSHIKIANPESLQDLHHLNDLRNALVHFRLCDISVIEDNDGVIKYYQEPPEVFQHIKSYKVQDWSVIAADVKNNVAWNLRISTNAMAIWAIKLILDAITYVLCNLPKGKYRDFILKYYRDKERSNIFEKGKYFIKKFENKIFKK